MNDIKLKTCKTCGIDKELETNFYFHSATGYYKNTCIDCCNIERRSKVIPKIGRREKGQLIRTKKCSICEEIKDINEDNFRRLKGLRTNFAKSCKSCETKRNEETKRKKESKGYLPDSETKKCIRCKHEKFITEFSYSKANGYYSSFCKKCDVSRKDDLSSEQKEKQKEQRRNWHINNKPKSLLNTYKKFDFQRNLENDLDVEFIKEKILKPCAYCSYKSTGLDRLDNSKGHLKLNCISCCTECNVARNSNFSYEEMKIIGEAIKKVKDNRINNA